MKTSIEYENDQSYVGQKQEFELLKQAENVLAVAKTHGVSVFARQHPPFAPDELHEEDTVIIVLRGKHAVELGRETLVSAADLVRAAL